MNAVNPKDVANKGSGESSGGSSTNWYDHIGQGMDLLIKGSEVYNAWSGNDRQGAPGVPGAPIPTNAGINVSPMLLLGAAAVVGVGFYVATSGKKGK